ncbi:hypothetical protein BGZ96_012053 [Linnemannia gamsii]|uniref:Uncharacterized protein n=1 Tax=Linnemannia gamsii TaxID=64522 RepID=A0ABQ7JRM3_9FUNG|nr:hypothetical protein BGZ96_012053 [Linnemannia gamsii]
MYARNLVTLVLLALCALCSFSSVFAYGPPPPQATDKIVVTSPKRDKVYKVGDQIHVKVTLPGGKNNILYKNNTPIQLTIQKQIPLPNLNKDIGCVPARTLATTGFSFEALEEYITVSQSGIRCRVRASFNLEPNGFGGYSDSWGFFIRD